MLLPLAEELRPKNISEYIGQKHLMGEGAVLYTAIKSGSLPSMILWGPPGTGKTTIANLIAKEFDRPFFTLSATNAGVKEVREVLHNAEKNIMFGKPILFIDEIHRFSKSQQDSLLAAVEKGIVTFIGATTENPSFEVISPLLSRCQVYILQSLSSEDLDILIAKAKQHCEKSYKIEIVIESDKALKRISGGDGRKLFNAFEIVCSVLIEKLENKNTNLKQSITINDENISSIIQQNLSTYDKGGENHYDIISAFIKSIRGSDPNAAVYYLARMLSGGEDVKFIARRLLILASEDIGNANPNALLLANACFDTVHKIGYPECRITLSQTTIYLACSVKSNSSYLAIDNALDCVKKTGDLAVPLHLRNAPTKLMKEIGYGKNYKYAHNYESNFTEQEFLPKDVVNTAFYIPSDNAKENEMRNNLKNKWKDKYNY